MPRFWSFALFLSVLLVAVSPVWAQGALNPVTWSASAPRDVRAGEIGKIEVRAQIAAPWHIYAPTTPKGGPNPTTLEIVPTAGLKSVGKIAQETPQKKFDKGFNLTVEIYAKKASFQLPVQIAKTASGTLKTRVKIRFQACNERLCLPPKTIELPIALTVAPGAARADKTKIAAGAPIAIKKAGGLLSLIGAAFVGGFLALFTPCVFPMIPITVSLFTKKNGQTQRAFAGPLAYCFGIVSTFTTVGVLVSVIFGASGLTRFAANPYVNLALAALFVVLALNLFGVYEIIVPGALLNRVQPRGRDGLLAPFLMGLAFTLTSFTCTVPFVGTTLVSTATQGALYPAVGMLCFSTAFALPFFLLALFPTALARLPRSGEWLVSVKAFMGFLELAAALKFVQSADYIWGLGILTRPVFLAIWFALAAIAGAYLLRWLRLPHDSPDQKIGPFRRVLGLGTLGAALWLLAANNGAPLGDLEAFPPPPEYGQKSGASQRWIQNDLKTALARSKSEGKPLLINFTGYACTNCRLMERNVLPRPEVTRELDGFVPVELFTDAPTPASRSFSEFQQRKFGTVAIPLYAVVTPDGQIAGRLEGLERDPLKFARFLNESKLRSVGVESGERGVES